MSNISIRLNGQTITAEREIRIEGNKVFVDGVCDADCNITGSIFELIPFVGRVVKDNPFTIVPV